MDIAAISIGLSQGKVQQQACLSVMKLVMDGAKQQANALTMPAVPDQSSLPVALHPYSGKTLDIKV